MCAKSFQKREIIQAQLVREVFTKEMEIDLGMNNGWIERNGKVNAIDKGDRAGIYKASLGPDKT